MSIDSMLFEFKRTTPMRILTVAVVLIRFDVQKLQCSEKTQAALGVRFRILSAAL